MQNIQNSVSLVAHGHGSPYPSEDVFPLVFVRDLKYEVHVPRACTEQHVQMSKDLTHFIDINDRCRLTGFPSNATQNGGWVRE